MKQFLKYAFRWQLSSIILAPCIYFLPGNAMNYEEAKASLASDSG